MAEPGGWGRGGGRRPRARLATQLALVTTLVAIVAVAVSFVVSANLVRSAAERQERDTLGHYAQLLADQAGTGTGGLRLRAASPAMRELSRIAQIRPLWVLPTGRVLGGPLLAAELPASVLQAAAAGQSVDVTAQLGRQTYFVAGRPLASGDGDVLLVQPRTATASVTRPLRNNIVVALLVGLGVAALGGAALSRRLARPLVHAAAAAGRLARGERDVRVQPEGPAEVAAVSESINALAGALATSEDRQRRFLLSVSHELRTPLTAIGGYAEALADGVVPAADARRVGETIRTESARMERLVSDLLDLARLGADDFRVEAAQVDVGELVAAAGLVWADRCRREGVVLRMELPAEPAVITSDAGRVRQILDGLAENALRVTPAGAPIVFALQRTAGGGAQLQVRDGGPGLSDDDLAVAFERSALYDRYRGVRRVGTGVGLALIAALAARLGGRASAGHAPEGGACFTVQLPAAPARIPAGHSGRTEP